MSGMAAEIAARMAAEGTVLPNDPAPVAGGVPGNEGGNAPPAAEPSNTDTGASGQVPDTIPYPRFKEVNDRYNDLKPFEELREFGYDADSLRRLAAFEATYQSDPIGTWAEMADRLDLPQELKDAVKTHVAAPSNQPGSAEVTPSGTSTPQAPELSADDRAALDYAKTVRARDEESAREAQLARVVAAWDGMDTQDNTKTPERIKLMAIASTAGSGQTFQTVEQLAKAARDTVMEYRSEVLGDAVIRTGHRGLPPALPGSLPSAAPPVNFGGDIRAASKAAAAAIERGELPE